MIAAIEKLRTELDELRKTSGSVGIAMAPPGDRQRGTRIMAIGLIRANCLSLFCSDEATEAGRGRRC